MERAARLFRSKNFVKELFAEEDVARAAWPVAVGKAIASHTAASKLVRDKLIVTVEDAVWQRQLNSLSGQIIQQIHRVMGSNIVQELEFRIAIATESRTTAEPGRVLKRAPQRTELREAATENSPAVADEAETISDPVLKKVYLLSRKKASA